MKKWIVVRHLYTAGRSARVFVAAMQEKFPEIKFKIGYVGVKDRTVTTSIMGFLPSPHPNDTAREVCEFAASLDETVTWTAPVK